MIGTTIQFGFGLTVATTGSSTNPYKFAATSGYRDDGDAGLSHVAARYYDAQVGRFITRDTELDQHPYLYCEHDPINAVDPSGHDKMIADPTKIPKWIIPNLGPITWPIAHKKPIPIGAIIDVGSQYVLGGGTIGIGDGGRLGLPFYHPPHWKPIINIQIGAGPVGSVTPTRPGYSPFPISGGAGIIVSGPGGPGFGFGGGANMGGGTVGVIGIGYRF